MLVMQWLPYSVHNDVTKGSKSQVDKVVGKGIDVLTPFAPPYTSGLLYNIGLNTDTLTLTGGTVN